MAEFLQLSLSFSSSVVGCQVNSQSFLLIEKLGCKFIGRRRRTPGDTSQHKLLATGLNSLDN